MDENTGIPQNKKPDLQIYITMISVIVVMGALSIYLILSIFFPDAWITDQLKQFLS